MGWRVAYRIFFEKTTAQIAGNRTSQACNLYLNSQYFDKYFLEKLHSSILF